MPSPDDLSMWTVYNRPLDYPQGFIARLFRVQGGAVVATIRTVQADTLAGVREQLPQGLYRVGRSESDEPSVVETWL